MNKPILYTIDCPACKVLEKKLNGANIEYDIVNCLVENPKNMQVFPQLEVNGHIMSYTEAVKWVKAQ